MIVDIRGNVVQPPEIFFVKSQTIVDRGWGLGVAPPDEERVAEYAEKTVEYMDSVGTDFQLVVPRVYHLAHTEKPAGVVHQWVGMYNDMIAGQAHARPDRLAAVGALPQIAGESPASSLAELDRCAEELGCVAVVLNPDPGEGDGLTPHLGDEHWYPLYERLVELDMPALVLSGACRNPRESYVVHHVNEATNAVFALLENPRVFEDFPSLKLVIGYGGGSFPYQVGRWRIRRWRQPELEPLEDGIARLWFDTVVHTREALELLFKVCGPERCLFGAQKPGAGSGQNPETGRWGDDLRPLIESIDWLGEHERSMIFEQNARTVFTRMAPSPSLITMQED